jgi:hypothetical protein
VLRLSISIVMIGSEIAPLLFLIKKLQLAPRHVCVRVSMILFIWWVHEYKAGC